MRIGTVSLLTNDVLSLASFYKQLLEIENDSEDEIHQVLIAEETALTIYNDGSIKNNQNICLNSLCHILRNHHLHCTFPLFCADRPRFTVADI